ncbi:hypothetical protein QOZ80_9BG0705620 [Eleusine coracana subsp. coracana]|nr:hypothetical protein QOZ80_9BG0705620 [Eleusine coracana subsp. coracana]
MVWFEKRSSFMVLLVSLVLLLTREAAATSSKDPSYSAPQTRKLLSTSEPSRGTEPYSTARMGPDDCSEEDVAVYQNSANPLPSGIPTYTVQIVNVCGGCRVSDVHVACGDFASTELVDPGVFQRVGFNDCIVKGGQPMEPSETVSFQYSNSFSYPLNVVSVSCA